MPDKSFDVVININSRAEGVAASQAMIADLRANIDQANVSAAEGNVLFEQQAAIQGEVNAMVGIRRELLEAQLTGNEAAVALARDELAIHSQTLVTLRSETLSHEAINALLADQTALLTLASGKQKETAGFSLLAGANLNKAKGEATVLARELATGSLNARTMGAFLGSLGPTLTIGAIGGFALFEIIKRSVDEAAKLEKEMTKQAEALFKQVDQWKQLALAAGEFSDVTKLGEKIDTELDKAAEKLREFRQEQQKILDAFAKMEQAGVDLNSGDPYSAGKGTPSDAKVEQQAQIVAKGLEEARQMLELAEQSRTAWDQIRLEPAAQGVEEVKSKVAELRSEVEKLKPLTILPPNATPGQIAAAANALDQYIKKLQELDLWEKRGEGRQKQSDRDAEIAQRREITNLLKEEELVLQKIKGDQEIISKNPFLSVDSRQDALHTSALREQATVLAEIQKIETEISKLHGSADPKTQEEVTQLTQKLNALKTEYQLLGFEIQKTTFGGEVRADLANWVNSWGTAAHQIASTIQGTIGVALQGLNQYILTGKFNVQDLERQFISLGLQLLEQLAIQKIASLLNITTTTGAASGAAALVSGAWATPAMLVSIATEGEADIVGQAGFTDALFTARGLAAGGFTKGGYTGDKDEHQIAGVVHGGEYVFTAEETDALGLPFLQQLASAAGGRAVVGKPGPVFLGPPKRLRGYDQGGFVFNPITGLPEDPGTYSSPIWQSVPISALGAPNPFSGVTVGGFVGGNPGSVQIGTDPWAGAIASGSAYVDPFSGALIDASSGQVIDPFYGVSASGFVGGNPGSVQIGTDPWAGAIASGSAYVDPFSGAVIDASTGQVLTPPPFSGMGAAGSALGAAASAASTFTGQFQSGTWVPVGGVAGKSYGSMGYSMIGVPGTFVTTPSGQKYSTAVGMFGLGAMNAPGGYMPVGLGSGPFDGLGKSGGGEAEISSKHGQMLEGWNQVGPQQYPLIWTYEKGQSTAFAGFNTKPGWFVTSYTTDPSLAAPMPTLPGKIGQIVTGPPKLHSGGSINEMLINAEIGEHMIQKRAADYYGHDTLDLINHMRIPVERLKFHDGGQIGSDPAQFFLPPEPAGKRPGNIERMPPIIVHIYHDINNAIRAYSESPAGRSHLVTTVKKNS